MSNLAEEGWGGLDGLEMTEAKNPCGQLSAPNGVWYVAAGRLCFGSTGEDLQESAPPFSLNDSLPPPPPNSPGLKTATTENCERK